MNLGSWAKLGALAAARRRVQLPRARPRFAQSCAEDRRPTGRLPSRQLGGRRISLLMAWAEREMRPRWSIAVKIDS